MWCTVETFWCDESYTLATSFIQCGLLLSLADVMNLILILSSPLNMQGREAYLCNFVEKKTNKKAFNVGLDSDILRPISFRFGTVIGTIKFYILISVWMALTSVQGHSCMRNQKLRCSLEISLSIRLNSACYHNLLIC